MQILKKSVSILLTVILVVSLFTIIPASVSAAGAVAYVYRWWDADAKEVKQETRTCSDYTEMSERSSDELESGWYAASGNLFIDSRLFVRNGKTVNLILKDGATLNVHRGIGVESGATLNIYGQSQGTGTLEVVFDPGDDRNYDNAMIGGTGEDGSSGTISIHGGVLRLDSEGPRGAGIGGGSKGSPYIISIYGGDISVSAFGAGAGIGGGYKASASSYNGEGIRIYGGTIEAESYTGAGIGNGYYEDSSYGSVAIYGGSVNARSLGGGAGIGGGMMGANGKIYIYGGDVNATAEDDDGQAGAGIGSGANRQLLNWENDRDINISGGSVSAFSETGAGIGAGYRRDGGKVNITGGVVFACSTGGGAGIGGGFGKSGGEINIRDAIVLAYSTGNVDESVFNTVSSNMLSAAQNAIHTFGSSLDGSGLSAITGAFSSLGALFNANSGRGYGAGIGGGDKGKSGTINIKNSIIIARGGDLGPGIGCGKQSRYGNITIEESYVDTVGGNNGAGIGGGNEAGPADNTKISIIGSTVKATGGSESAGIGSGNEYPNYGTIEIDSSTVEAHGGAYAAGIGGGDGGSGSGSITIRNGSDVKAYAGEDAAGIGGGEGGSGGSIEIEDSTVYAQGNYYGAGIGGGENGGAGTITISGESTVTGVGGDNGSSTRGIGHGAYDSFVSFFTRDYPSNGQMIFSETFLVRIGEDKDHTRVVPATYIYENGRGDETRYISIYPCTHENLENYANEYCHGQRCSYCHEVITAEEHIWGSDNKCTVCGVSANMIPVTLKEQNNDGEVTRTLGVPWDSSFTLPKPENVPDGMEFVCWTDGRTPMYAGDDLVVDQSHTFTAVYASVVETTYIDENGEQQTVLARKFPITEYEAGPLYSGWYVIDEDIPEDFGSRAMVYGDVKLILADDVTVSSRFLYFEESNFNASSLSVYGQAKQTGTISCDSANYGPITGFTQYGGKVNIYSLQAVNCKIAGGVFDAYRLEVSDKIELGWSGWSDSITVHDYRYNDTDPEISVIEGKQLKNTFNNNVYNPGVLSENQKRNINNVPLVPAVDYKFTGPTWSWSEDRTEATATFTGYNVKPEVRASIERTLDGVYMVSTASVTFMGEVYTNTKHDQVRWCVINNTNDTSVHGTVALSADMAEPGELVEITATPNRNYTVKSVNIRPAKSSKTVEIIGDGEAFIMPDCDVSVNVVFEQTAPSPITIHTTGNGTVTANVDKALEDDEITLNISPEEDHQLGSISAACADDADTKRVKLTALSGDGEGDQGYAKLLDNSPYTKWCIGVTEPRHIIMKANAPVFMTGYSLRTGNDNASYKGRNWKDYTIYGANFASDSEATRDSAQWQVVKAVENDSVTQDVNSTTFDYSLDTPAAAYQYFKIEITSNKGGSSIQMSEFEMQAAALHEITLSGEGNTRTFAMPVYPVLVTAEFVPSTTRVITWQNEDGSVIDTQDVELGTVPSHDAPEKAEDLCYTYSFVGWNDGESTYAPDELPAVTKRTTYTAVFEAVRKPYFSGHSLSLNGDIGVNYYLNLTDQEITDKAVVDFVWTVDGKEKTHSVTLAAADKTSCGYKASCPIAVAEMTYDITAALTIGGVRQDETDTYSAQRYAQVILTNEKFRDYFTELKGQAKYDQLVTLVKAMLDYGSKAQIRFNRNTDRLANGGTDYFTDEVNIPNGASDMSEYLGDCGLEYVGTSVVYLSETTLRHYYRIVDPSKFTDEIKNGITFDGEAVTCGVKNGMIYFDKKDIAASQLDTEYVIRINGHEYPYSALDYSALSYGSDDKPYSDSITKQLAAAVYRYNQAANAYFAD